MLKYRTKLFSDPKFAVKLRMLGCVRTMHLILKGHFTDNKLIFPLLVIMKQLAKNGKLQSVYLLTPFSFPKQSLAAVLLIK